MKKVMTGIIITVVLLALSIPLLATENSQSTKFQCSINGYGNIMDNNGNFIDRDTFIADLTQQVDEGKITQKAMDQMIQQYNKMKEYCTQNDITPTDNSVAASTTGQSRFGCH